MLSNLTQSFYTYVVLGVIAIPDIAVAFAILVLVTIIEMSARYQNLEIRTKDVPLSLFYTATNAVKGMLIISLFALLYHLYIRST